MVEPVEYVLNAREKKSFQYVPILNSLSEILKKEILDYLINSGKELQSNSETQYISFHDGTHLKANK